MEPTRDHKAWGKHLQELLDGDMVVNEYWDANEEHSIPVLESRNDEGVVAATIGLMEINQVDDQKKPIFTELLMDARGQDFPVAEMVSTLAFFIIKDGWRVAPGVTFGNIMDMYDLKLKVKHILFVPPFQWEDEMSKVKLKGKTIYPLLAVPITDKELKLVKDQGEMALVDIWERDEVDVLDWERKSAV
jgi:antitoxin YqcF